MMPKLIKICEVVCHRNSNFNSQPARSTSDGEVEAIKTLPEEVT